MNKKFGIFLMALVLLVLPVAAFALTPGEWVQGILDRLLSYVIRPLFLGAAVIMTIWAGFLFLTARGDATKVADAKKVLIYIVVGIVVYLLAASMVTLIGNVITPTNTPHIV